MKIDEVITYLKSSKLVAACNECYEEFKLKDVIMFDGRKRNPTVVEPIILEYDNRLDKLRTKNQKLLEGVTVRAKREA